MAAMRRFLSSCLEAMRMWRRTEQASLEKPPHRHIYEPQTTDESPAYDNFHGIIRLGCTFSRKLSNDNHLRGTPETWRTCRFDKPSNASSKSIAPLASRERCKPAGPHATPASRAALTGRQAQGAARAPRQAGGGALAMAPAPKTSFHI